MLNRDKLIEKYQRGHQVFLATAQVNTNLKPGDKVGWFTKERNKRATWRGTIERVWTPVLIEGGQVIGFEPKADFKAPSWRNSFPVSVNQLRLT